MDSIDTELFLWLNGWVGTFPLFDSLVKVIDSDYLVPATLSMVLLGLWFAGNSPDTRMKLQKAVFVGAASIGAANLVVNLVNNFYFRPRPFNQHDVSLLFYRATDSSFPSNPAAVAFAVATAGWLTNKKLGWALYALACVFALSRVYAGVFYPSDILAGAGIGLVVALVMHVVRILIEPLPTMVVKLARIFCLA